MTGGKMTERQPTSQVTPTPPSPYLKTMSKERAGGFRQIISLGEPILTSLSILTLLVSYPSIQRKELTPIHPALIRISDPLKTGFTPNSIHQLWSTQSPTYPKYHTP